MANHSKRNATKKIEYNSKAENKSKTEHKSHEVNTTLVAVFALAAILIITWIAISTNSAAVNNSRNDVVGQASGVIVETIADTKLCNIILGTTKYYGATNLIVGLHEESITYYAGYNVLIKSVNSNGCIVDINENSDYIAVGQIQKVGPLYVTVKSISG
ncbi:MAG: hypothetical protein ACP5N1_01010 [Candidatus Woesearchaeota archaeon]